MSNNKFQIKEAVFQWRNFPFGSSGVDPLPPIFWMPVQPNVEEYALHHPVLLHPYYASVFP